jgi:hypothetical protein
MDWYDRLLRAITQLLCNQDPEAQTILSILIEPTYGSEQEFAIELAVKRGWVA